MRNTGRHSKLQQEIRAAIYCRISLSRFGDTVKVDDQERICRDLATAKGWEIAEGQVHKDNSVSAWRHDVRRPAWEAMLGAIESGDANAIIVYHGDRLIRQPWDLEVLLRLANDRGIQLASPTGERDLSNEDDRFILRIEAAAQCREVAATSRRMKGMFERQAERGRCRLGGRGGRAFGFEPDGMTIREADAEMIRDVAGRIVRGETVGAICRDLNARGYRTTPGNEWNHMALKRLMLRPRLAGLLARFGQVVGPAAWPAILLRDEWEAVCAILEGKQQAFGYTTNVHRYFLTGIALCGGCEAPVVIRHNTRSETLRGYGCINPACPRKVHRQVRPVDLFVTGAAVRRLQDPKLRAAMMPAPSAHLVEELARMEGRRERKLADFADDDDPLAADVLRVAIARIDRQLAEVRAQIGAARSAHILDGLWGLTVEQFDTLDLARRRSAVAALLRVTILPTGRRGPGFDPASVRLDPATPAR